MIAKKFKILLPTTSPHYPFVLTKAETMFEEIIKGKQPIK